MDKLGKRGLLCCGGYYSWNKYLRQLSLYLIILPNLEYKTLITTPNSQPCLPSDEAALYGPLSFHSSLKIIPYEALGSPLDLSSYPRAFIS